jgi:hypothetical protein
LLLKTDQGARETRRILGLIQKTLRAQYVIAVGICYGLKDKKLKLGDVIISRTIFDISLKRVQEGDIKIYQSANKAGDRLYDTFWIKDGFEFKHSGDDKPVDICQSCCQLG